MADLELIGLDDDGENILVRSSDGSQFRLAITESLRAAVRRDRPQFEHLRSKASGALAPREIQSQIRAGRTAQEVAEAADISIKQVRRYEGPILAEREFIANQARATQVGREADAPELGDLVTDRLAAREVDTSELRWDSFREGNGPWTIFVEFRVGTDPMRASWTFDVQARHLTALDDESRWLSETALPDEPVPRRHLTPVRSRVFDIESHPQDEPAPESEAEPTPPEDTTSQILHDLQAKRGHRQEIEITDSEDANDQFEGFGPQQTFAFEGPGLDPSAELAGEPSADPTPSGRLYSLADGPSGRRSSPVSPVAPSASEPVAPSTETDTETETETEAQPDDNVPLPLERVKSGRKGRAQVPSWDEIVFGAKPE